MGILTLLRNAFGRSRKGRTAEAEGVTPSPEPQPTVPSPTPEPQPPATAQVPEPRASEPAKPTVPEQAERTEPTESDRTEQEEHELVAAAFDNVTVPKPAEPTEPPTTEEPAAETPVAEQPAAETPVAEQPAAEEPVTQAPAAEEPAPQPEAEEPAPEPVTAEATPEPATEPTPNEPAAADGEDAPQGTPAPDDETHTGGAGGNTKAEGEAEATPEPATEPTPDEPAAADGEDAPQGPPAPDDETRTGGAGGDTKAEGEAEATPEPATEPTPEANPAPPIPRTLRTAHRAAATALKKHNLTGTRAKVYLVLDRSASMRPYYKDGSAQALGDQTLALAAHLDPETANPTVHVVFFSTELDGTADLTLTDHENKIDELHASLGRMGRTSYHVAVEEVITHHHKTSPDTPALVIFQTDGAPDAKTPATHALTVAAKNHPSVFFCFVAFGDPDQKAFDYLRKLKTDNTAHFMAGETPLELTDKQLYEGILANWRP
ncbi:VWA domain-containing protein [Streptomyces sp. ISL-22]|uniref:VWA domain-containing protein n=1 Tax=unclassified Streptomyces TaxID=2593676 RepID=UPI001BE95D22|nr:MULTISPECIES: VWA domain-containing protein [unclassified Streptomyces]MBT2418628.1 VWA domain-containing protein [Streptomyces sp. ISL-24]MBT2432960.1 VWA domain-containing protein [Streptomyces sp. ISL-22]